ncbi:MAG: type II toxin-antitoxin system VapC family toxin [Acidobacteria bacterium]|nr:type II toxin-antitoxin system VapC family toxin [Acidobacteriota bacterium]
MRARPAALAGPAVVDASVVVEFLVRLALTEQARALFARVAGEDPVELWAPDLVYAECASALRKLVARKHLGAEDGRRAVARLGRLPIAAVGTSALLDEVWDLRGHVTPYDACYVVLARRLEAPLVTADSRLARTLARLGDAVLPLEEIGAAGRPRQGG